MTTTYTVWFLQNYSNPSIWTIDTTNSTITSYSLHQYYNSFTPFQNFQKTLVYQSRGSITKEISLNTIYYNILDSTGFYSSLNDGTITLSDYANYYLSNYYFSLAVKDGCKYYVLQVYYNYYPSAQITYTCARTNTPTSIQCPILFLFMFVAPYCVNKPPLTSLWSLERIVLGGSPNQNNIAYLTGTTIPQFFTDFQNQELKSIIPPNLVPEFFKNFDYENLFNFNNSFPL